MCEVILPAPAGVAQHTMHMNCGGYVKCAVMSYTRGTDLPIQGLAHPECTSWCRCVAATTQRVVLAWTLVSLLVFFIVWMAHADCI